MNIGDRDSVPQLWKGLPQTAHSALTPLGEIEQAAKIAEGFRRPRQGWRRVVFIAGGVIVALMAVFMLFFAIFAPA